MRDDRREGNLIGGAYGWLFESGREYTEQIAAWQVVRPKRRDVSQARHIEQVLLDVEGLPPCLHLHTTPEPSDQEREVVGLAAVAAELLDHAHQAVAHGFW